MSARDPSPSGTAAELRSLAFTLLLSACGAEKLETEGEEPPSFVLVMADDLGYGDLGCYGGEEIRTPHLDRMAREGLRLTSHYANGPVCTPTRAALLTGRYPQRCGLEGVIYASGDTREAGLPPREVTLAELLKARGYATGAVGKWHLGFQRRFSPIRQGFDEFHGFVSGNIDYHSHRDLTGSHDWWSGEQPLTEEGYATDLITRHAVEFIERNRERPFFLYVAHAAPHAPFQGRGDGAHRLPGRGFSYEGPVEDKAAAYREMVEALDEGIGAILAALEAHGLAERTLVVFVSDNGAEREHGSNGGLRGAKGELFEGGIRVPGIAWWPGRVPAGVSDEPVAGFDWAPTFLALARASGLEHPPFDGIDLSDLLLHGWSPPRRALFWQYRGQQAAREGRWKLLLDGEGGGRLFDLEADPGERADLSDAHPARAARLSQRLRHWRAEVREGRLMLTE